MEPEKKSNGALLGLVVIIIILVVGGIYLWMSNKNAVDTTLPEDAATSQDSAALDALDLELQTVDTDLGNVENVE